MKFSLNINAVYEGDNIPGKLKDIVRVLADIGVDTNYDSIYSNSEISSYLESLPDYELPGFSKKCIDWMDDNWEIEKGNPFHKGIVLTGFEKANSDIPKSIFARLAEEFANYPDSYWPMCIVVKMFDEIQDEYLDAIWTKESCKNNKMKFSYFYRDAANYKNHSSIVLEGVLTPKQIVEMKELLEDEELFLPLDAGVPPMYFEETDSEIDHVWHTWGGFEPAEDFEVPTMSAQELYDNFMRTNGNWDIERHMKYLEDDFSC